METLSLTSFEGELIAEMTSVNTRPKEDFPFRILILGDWSGRTNRRAFSATEELKTWRPLLVDRDNLDHLIARLGVRLSIPITEDGTQTVAISFTVLDDFHPDRLFQRLDVFESLRGLRARLQDPETFAQAAIEVRKWNETALADTPPPEPNDIAAPPDRDDSTSAEGSILDQI